MNNPVKIWLALLAIVLVGYGAYRGQSLLKQPPTEESGPARPVRALDDFELVERSGEPVRLASLRGKVWAASFFFASCPGFCKQMNQAIAELQAELGVEGVTFVSVTVDPKNDTPERLRSYYSKLGAKGDPGTWLFLTGEPDDLRDLGEGVFKVPFSQEHNDRLMLVDKQGRIRGSFETRVATSLDAFKKKARELLAEEGAPAGQPSSANGE